MVVARRIPFFERFPYPRGGTPCNAFAIMSGEDGKTMYQGHFRKKEEHLMWWNKSLEVVTTPWLDKS